MPYQPLVSVIIPTYNEEMDIERTLEAVLSLEYEKKEVIVVDDSTDRTPHILDNYAKEGKIIFFRQDKNRGVSAARNRGIKAAIGEIVIILNADVVLNKSFIKEILPHYEKGADFVVCQSQIKNTDKIIPAFLDAQDHMWYDNRNDLIWSEGFSCRRQSLLDAGLFDEKFPSCSSGEDASLGEELNRRYKRVFDRSIIVPHIAPHTLKVFWKQRIGRGRGTPYRLFYTEKIPMNILLPFLIGVTTITFFQIALIYPLLKTVFRMFKFSKKGLWVIPFFALYETLDRIAQRKGEWKAYIEIKKREGYVERS